MRKKIVAGNWKMNLDYAKAMALVETISKAVQKDHSVLVILAPPFVYLHDLAGMVRNHPAISVAAQNCSDKNTGPFTGEVSAAMLSSIGVEYVIIGHSERRFLFNETNDALSGKVSMAIDHRLKPIYCCGEKMEERNAGTHLDTVKRQLEVGLFHQDKKGLEQCVIAYEPVWAIGTGTNATPGQIQEMHAFIRDLVKKKYGEHVADGISILYGGSISSSNAKDLFSCSDVDGGLIGGASLNANEFVAIISILEKL